MKLTLSFLTALMIFIPLLEGEVFAKKVSLEWKPIEGAIRYDIQILSNDSSVIQKSLDRTLWKGELEPGTYTYQIRAVDEVQRPGAWSARHPLVVMPPPPELKQPSDGAQMKVFTSKTSALLEWKPTTGASLYRIELKKNGQVISQYTATGSRLELKDLPVGQYTWSVSAVMKMSGRSPASLTGKEWNTPTSASYEFEIQQKFLDTPRLRDPSGTLPMPEKNHIVLEWKNVEGAEVYEVQLIKMNLAKTLRAPAQDLAQKFITRETKLKVPISGPGRYQWRVRALASVDENQVAQVVGPLSETEFELDRNAVYHKDLGYVALSTMLAPYNYKVVSPSRAVSSSTQSAAAVVRLSGEVWFKPQWGISAGTDIAFFKLAQQDFSRKSFELLLKYRAKLSSGSLGWSISPKFGFEMRDYNFIVQGDGISRSRAINSNTYSVLGPTVGVDIRRQFSDRFGLGIKIAYFYPMTFVEGLSQGASIQGGESYRNFSFGAQGVYWLGSKLGLGAGGFIDMRSLSFLPNGNSSKESVSADGTYFFGSVIFRFWK